MPEKDRISGINDKGKDYLSSLKQRGKESHVYKKYQMTGLMLAEILGDNAHKALYIKLAKEHNEERLIRLARDIAEKRNVKNKGAYFMRMLFDGGNYSSHNK